MKYSWSLLLLCLLSAACRKDPDPVPAPQPAAPELVFDFAAVVQGQGKLIKDSVYDNHVGDKFSAGVFKYYISNISLVRADHLVFTEPESYHLISHFEGKERFTVKNIPKGDYVAVRFTIGVDSARNVSGAQTGDLDVSNNMFWDWDTGYLFYK